MIPSVLASQLIRGTKDFLSTTFPSSTPAFFDIMDNFVNEKGKLFKGPYISVALPVSNLASAVASGGVSTSLLYFFRQRALEH